MRGACRVVRSGLATLAVGAFAACALDASAARAASPIDDADDAGTASATLVTEAAQPRPQPAVGKWRMIDYTGSGLWFEAGVRGWDIPLQNTGGCDDIDFPHTEREVVGWVQGEGRAAPVTARCVEHDDGRLAIRLSVEGLSLDGIDYTGTIDFDPDDDKSPTVELTVRRTLKPSLFLALLGVGVALAFVARWWTESGKPVAEQQARLAKVRIRITEHGEANPLVEFVNATRAGGLDEVAQWDLATAVHATLAAQHEALKRTGRFWRPIGKSTNRFTTAQRALTDVETALSTWAGLGDLLVRLDGLRDDLGELPAFEADVLGATLERASGDIAVADVETIREQAQVGVDVATTWPAGDAAHVRRRYAALQRSSGDAHFAQAKAAAIAAWTVYDRRAGSARTVNEINAAAIALFEADGAIQAAASLGSGDIRPATALEVDRLRPPRRIESDAVIKRTATTQLRRLEVRQRLIDYLLLAAVLVAALLAGMQALYADKAVGGTWDFVVIAMWGFTAATVAQPITAAIQRIADGLTRDSDPPPS